MISWFWLKFRWLYLTFRLKFRWLYLSFRLKFRWLYLSFRLKFRWLCLSFRLKFRWIYLSFRLKFRWLYLSFRLKFRWLCLSFRLKFRWLYLSVRLKFRWLYLSFGLRYFKNFKRDMELWFMPSLLNILNNLILTKFPCVKRHVAPLYCTVFAFFSVFHTKSPPPPLPLALHTATVHQESCIWYPRWWPWGSKGPPIRGMRIGCRVNAPGFNLPSYCSQSRLKFRKFHLIGRSNQTPGC